LGLLKIRGLTTILHDECLQRYLLARIPMLRVAARTSFLSFKDKGIEIPGITRRLHVAHVPESSAPKSGDHVRITAHLIHATDGFEL